MTQRCLASALGVSFQQVQKYETGASCICVGRLQLMAQVLDAPVTFFFPEPDLAGADHGEPGGGAGLLASPEAVEITLAAMRITDPKLRRRLLELVRSIALGPRDAPPRG